MDGIERRNEMTKVFRTAIVDDEPFVRADLRHLLSAIDNIEVVWEAGSLDRAKELLKTTRTDLIFLDIMLRGGSGFDLIPLIDHEKTQVIIVTAHEKYLAQAESTVVQECLLKPVSSLGLANAISRLS